MSNPTPRQELIAEILLSIGITLIIGYVFYTIISLLD